jgi:choline dehydrogenase
LLRSFNIFLVTSCPHVKYWGFPFGVPFVNLIEQIYDGLPAMKYDVLIIGAGSAGAILGARLSEDPERSVLLLEAGPDYPHFEHLPEEIKYGYGTKIDIMTSSHNWQFVGKATNQTPKMLVPRGKVTGGSSAIGGQAFLRGVPEDYDSWAAMGNNQWGFQELLPYFRKLETDQDFDDEFHGRTGPIRTHRFPRDAWQPSQLAFYEACRSTGFPDCADHNHPQSTGVGPMPMNNPNGIRISTALGYLAQARHRLNLTIRANCMVRRLVFGGNQVKGVEVESGGAPFLFEADEIILSAGAIGSPHILLLSGIGPAAQLTHLGVPMVRDLPGVGQNLRDHPQARVTWRTNPDFPLDGMAPRRQVCLRYTAEGSHLRNDMKISMLSFATERINRGGSRMKAIGIRMTASIQSAVGKGELRLTSRDPEVQPFLDYCYLEDEFDRQRLREAVRLCVRLADHPSFRDIIAERLEPPNAVLASDEALVAWLLHDVSTSQHISGTCKMGPAADPTSVVDQYGRVHGMDNLRVVDASIMPDCIRANTNVTTMMIGERVADFIRQGM